jgi:hypothetical protein
MNKRRLVANALLALGAGWLFFAAPTQSAQAQAIFCPSSIPNQSGIALSQGTCTNGPTATGTGAFSNAALASQALSDLSQSTTQQASATVETTLGVRRQVEQERCAEGFERVNGMCQRIVSAEPPPAPPPAVPSPTLSAPAGPAQSSLAPAPNAKPATPRRAATAPRVATRAAPIYKAPPLQPAVRFATWVEGFGDYERRSGTSSTSIVCCQGVGGQPNTLLLTGDSRANLGGVLGGYDATFRNVGAANDAVIVGALGGYMSSDVRLITTSISTKPANVPNGGSTLNAHLEGPSAGAYVTYFNDRFSGDLTFRADFLSLSESFVDILGFTLNANPLPVLGTFVQSAFAGSGSTRLNNYTTTGNVNYRVPLSMTSWIEPTAGVQYTLSDYDESAAALGLSNGSLVKVQAGARYGMESLWGTMKLTTTVTGLAYDDVIETGGFIQNVAFGTNALIINDEGLLRGQGILALNLAYASGISVFAQGDVRGGKDLFGVGGKGGIRFQW